MIRLTKIRYLWNFSVLPPLYFSFFVVIGFYSCATISMQTLNIQVAGKEKHPLTNDIQSITILNRAITPAFSTINIDSLERQLTLNKFITNSVLYDSLAADTAIQVAARALFESERYDVVVPVQRFIGRYDSDHLPPILPTTFIKEICADFKTDAVLVLESFDERIATALILVDINLNEIKLLKIFLIYNSVWRIYQPNDSNAVRRFELSDSIVYNKTGLSLKDVKANPPFLKEALIDGGIAAGLKIASHISPQWINYERDYYFTGIREIDAAIPLIKKNKWEEAAAIWTRYVDVPSVSLRSKVEYNLGLASEMIGDLDLAIQWCNKSLKSRSILNTQVYLRALEIRQKEQVSSLILNKAD